MAEVLKSSQAARHFGIALVLLGIAMLVLGIGYHVMFMYGLRRERQQMKAAGLVHAEVSLTLMVALLLLAIGFMAIANMVYDFGPFG
jgi:putative membrane protein